MSTQPKPFLTPEQYLELERAAEFRSEYINGEMFAMSGASRQHGAISVNAAAALHRQLRGRPCRFYVSDMRVFIPATGLYTYPDLVGLCGNEQFLDAAQDTLINPTFIVEVLSRSTEAYDRGKKFGHYRSIPSLLEYALISTDSRNVDLYRKQEDGDWKIFSSVNSLDLVTVGASITLDDLYEGVDVPA